jgi:hypothetical protein
MMAFILRARRHVAVDLVVVQAIHFDRMEGTNMSTSIVNIAGDRALAIAQSDAAVAYRDLSPFRIQIVLEDDGWHVDYELKDARLKGGGPHYLIDAQTGAILSKRYEQ